MKVMRIHEYGGPEQLKYEEAPRPVAAAGQLLVRVAASSVNPADWKIRSGAVQAMMKFPMPLILGGDIAGTVEEIGEGVAGWRRGDAVFAMVGLVGAYAGYVAVDAAAVARKPETLEFEDAASLPLVALTAWQCLARDERDVAGLHVLIHGAAGGVGSIGVQLAVARGARVLATASAKNAEFVTALGAYRVFDIRETSIAGMPRDIDMVLDFVGDAAALALLPLVKAGGSLTRIGGQIDPKLGEAANVRTANVRVRPSGAQLSEIAGLVDAGKVKPVVARVLPLAQAGEAQSCSQAGHMRGKIVLRMEDEGG